MGAIESAASVRVAFYARVSSDKQVQDRTIASQVEALQERVRQDGFLLDPELRFIDDGYSGTTLVRPALERLRDMAALGLIERLYVYAPDRLARKSAYQVLLLEELHREAVEVTFLNQPVRDQPQEQLLVQVQGIVAEYERAQILERRRRGKLHAARHGSINALGGAPYGYRYVPAREAGGHAAYEIVLEQARVVRQIFAWVSQERLSLRQVCRRLQNQGIPSATGKSWWNRSTISSLLKNPAYQGRAAYGKTRRGPRRPRLRPRRGSPAQPRQPHSVYDVPVDEQIAIPVPLWSNRKSLRRSRSNWPRIAGITVSGSAARDTCWRACPSAGTVDTPTTENRSVPGPPLAGTAPMRITAALAVTPVTSGDNVCVGTGQCVRIGWRKRSGMTSVPCSGSPSGSHASTNAA